MPMEVNYESLGTQFAPPSDKVWIRHCIASFHQRDGRIAAHIMTCHNESTREPGHLQLILKSDCKTTCTENHIDASIHTVLESRIKTNHILMMNFREAAAICVHIHNCQFLYLQCNAVSTILMIPIKQHLQHLWQCSLKKCRLWVLKNVYLEVLKFLAHIMLSGYFGPFNSLLLIL